jgi:sporulation protein YlmC with PRC-barrel domain
MADRDVNTPPVRPDGWRATLLAHRPVVDVSRVEQMGAVADLVFDPHRRQLVGLLLQRPGPEGTIVEMARRALGSALGLTFVSMEQVIALHGDVVTVDLSRGAPESAAPLPRLSKVVGFAVVTTRGQRLGRLVDLLLDSEGRRIQSYLVARGGHGVMPQRMNHLWTRPAAAPDAPTQDEHAEVEPPAGGAPPPDDLVVVPATLDVRIGRDMVVIAEAAPTGAQRPALDLDTQVVSPDEPTQQSTAPRWEPWEADAPTEQMRN